MGSGYWSSDVYETAERLRRRRAGDIASPPAGGTGLRLCGRGAIRGASRACVAQESLTAALRRHARSVTGKCTLRRKTARTPSPVSCTPR
jgi:hypothetical protein